MTVSTTTRKAGPYVGDGVVTSFAFAFKVFADTDLYVVRTDAAGIEAVKVLTTDYTVALNADQNTNPGGTVTYPVSGSPLPATDTLTLTSAVPETQTTQLPGGGAWNPATVEKRLDWLTILVQQALLKISRALKYPLSDTSASAELPTVTTRKGKFLYFNATTGDPEAASALSSAAVISAFMETVVDDVDA